MEYEINEIILNGNIQELEQFYERDYKLTIKIIFDILLGYIRTDNHNHDEVDSYIEALTEIVNLEEDNNRLKLLNNSIRNIVVEISGMKSSEKENRLKKIRFSIIDLNRIIADKKKTFKNNSMYSLLSYFVFEEKNMDIVEGIITDDKSILDYNDNEGNNLFYNILNKYICLNSKEKDDISYYYHLITLFLKDDNYETILKDKMIYLALLQQPFCKNKGHVKDIINRLQSFYSVENEELEDKYDISFSFPQYVIDEISKLVFTPKKRTNFLYQSPITIDCKGAECLDDALYIEKNDNGTYTLYCHIMDIPSIIPYANCINYEAYKRGETIYLTDDNVLLYPEFISNNVASLLPNANKNVFTYIVDIDTDYSVIEDSFRIERGIINIKNRLTYSETDRRFEKLSNSTLDSMLEMLALVALKLKGNNSKMSDYRRIENLVEHNSRNHSLYTDNSISNNIIQETAVLTNSLIPEYMSKHGFPYLYRNHVVPTDSFARKIVDEYLEKTDTEKIYDYKRFCSIIKENYLTASYSSKNEGHYGLDKKFYSHSSSPGRRYADGTCEYVIEDIIFNGNTSDDNLKLWEERIKETGEYLNERQSLNRKFASEYDYLASKKLIRKK